MNRAQSSSPELWDIYDAQGQRTGRTIQRGDPTGLVEGDYHLVVHIWPRDGCGRYLVQRRALSLAWLPGVWAGTGGSVVAGEESLAGAIRETEEELGIGLPGRAFTYRFRRCRADSIADVWEVHVDESTVATVHPGPEVHSVAWLDAAQVLERVRLGRFHDYGSDYFEQLFGKDGASP